jgi:hypothetical protein
VEVPKRKLVPVSERALMARIRRWLARGDERLATCREGSRGFQELGRYYIVDAKRNFIRHTNVDLEELGRKLGLLKEWEQLNDAKDWKSVFGVHRFYVGKVGTGLLQLVTLGGLGIWALVDLILIIVGSFRNKQDRRLFHWTEPAPA